MSLIRLSAELRQHRGQVVRYAVNGHHPPVAATVPFAEAFRIAALSAYFATVASRGSFLLSGHHKDGKPDTEHRHAYYLPQPDTAGTIRELLVVSPFKRFSSEEIMALQSVRAVQWGGPTARATLELLHLDDESALKVACRWISLTPFVPNRRFWGTHGKHHLTPDKQLIAEIAQRLPECSVECTKMLKLSDIRIRRTTKSETIVSHSPARRLGYYVEFRSQQPLCAPIALGHSCHFGLGQFLPLG